MKYSLKKKQFNKKRLSIFDQKQKRSRSNSYQKSLNKIGQYENKNQLKDIKHQYEINIHGPHSNSFSYNRQKKFSNNNLVMYDQQIIKRNHALKQTPSPNIINIHNQHKNIQSKQPHKDSSQRTNKFQKVQYETVKPQNKIVFQPVIRRSLSQSQRSKSLSKQYKIQRSQKQTRVQMKQNQKLDCLQCKELISLRKRLQQQDLQILYLKNHKQILESNIDLQYSPKKGCYNDKPSNIVYNDKNQQNSKQILTQNKQQINQSKLNELSSLLQQNNIKLYYLQQKVKQLETFQHNKLRKYIQQYQQTVIQFFRLKQFQWILYLEEFLSKITKKLYNKIDIFYNTFQDINQIFRIVKIKQEFIELSQRKNRNMLLIQHQSYVIGNQSDLSSIRADQDDFISQKDRVDLIILNDNIQQINKTCAVDKKMNLYNKLKERQQFLNQVHLYQKLSPFQANIMMQSKINLTNNIQKSNNYNYKYKNNNQIETNINQVSKSYLDFQTQLNNIKTNFKNIQTNQAQPQISFNQKSQFNVKSYQLKNQTEQTFQQQQLKIINILKHKKYKFPIDCWRDDMGFLRKKNQTYIFDQQGSVIMTNQTLFKKLQKAKIFV